MRRLMDPVLLYVFCMFFASSWPTGDLVTWGCFVLHLVFAQSQLNAIALLSVAIQTT